MDRSSHGELRGDLFSLAPGWLACLAVDPTSAAVAGLPIMALAAIVRRRLWPGARVRGRVVIGVLAPFVALSFAMSIGLSSAGAMAPWLLAFACLAAVERRRRLKGCPFASRHPLAAGLTFAALTAVFAALLFENGAFRTPTEEFIKAFAAPPDAPRWSPEAKRAAIEIAREAASRGRAPLGVSARGDAEAPEGVFVTLYDGAGHESRGFARGGQTAMDDVATAAHEARSGAPRGWKARSADLRVQIDIPGEMRNATTRPLFSWAGELFRGADPALVHIRNFGRLLDLSAGSEIGVDGFAFRAKGKREPLVVLPGDPITQGTLSPRVTSNPAAMAAIAMRASKTAAGDARLLERGCEGTWLFRTTSFASPSPGAVVDLYRGNTLLPATLDRKTLVERAALAISWLARRVEPDGRFYYEMVPPLRARTAGYSLPRHAGAVYGLLAAYRFGLEEKGLAAAGREALPAALASLEYMDRNLGAPSPSAEDLSCFLEDGGAAVSGSTALGAIAVMELPRPEQVADPSLAERVRAYPARKRLEGMTRCLLAMIDEDGAVFSSYREAQKRKKVAVEPLYYPGEVALALAKIYETTEDESALEGARRIADRQLRLYALPLLAQFPWSGDHWMIQALASLAATTGKNAYAELALLMARGYLREQYPPQAFLYPDYRGAYRRIFDVPRTTRAASRGEALGGALRAADILGEDATPFERSLIEGARHLAEQEYTRDNSTFVPASMDVLGGIRMGLVDDHLRIDNNQHGLVAMLNGIRAHDRLKAKGGF